MHILDWIVLIAIIVLIIGYGIWKTKSISSSESYLRGTRSLPWWTVGLSVMATQASAITFLSTPGQAYDDGLRFAQFYFGLPLAMIVLCVFVLPVYYRLKVYTAYEYLERRFDLKTRSLTAFLFLIQRGLAAGLTIFAPSIILSSILGWNLNITTLIIGVLVIIYTVTGGTIAVSQTQKQQMIIILTGLAITFLIILSKLPSNISFNDALGVAGDMGKLKAVDFKFDLSNKYNIWSALFGGTFLFLSYFGTDQSQVQRYLSGRSLRESQLGLLFNGIFKVPMQFMILFVGIMVFVFYQFNQAPLHFNKSNVKIIEQSVYADEYHQLEEQLQKVSEEKKQAIYTSIEQKRNDLDNTAAVASIHSALSREKDLRNQAKTLLGNYSKKLGKKLEKEDTDYVFINFVTGHLPTGLIGLLLAVIMCAAMSSTASELNALATTSMVDFYKRSFVQRAPDKHYLNMSRLFTLGWGIIAILCSMLITLFDNLIEAVNIIGSLFYGTILGVFTIAFFFKKIKANATFIGAIVGEVIVITLFLMGKNGFFQIAYLWFNLIGCIAVLCTAFISQRIIAIKTEKQLQLNTVNK
ncbi:sodium:solute symporter [Leptobacterium flavescens]|uniref:Sodium:solute symporter n=1 Tax=Leptobacterium flavescens TaxID=472055 RepID=A0A6P0UK82_9FLAO|nr:sodium:solute symporter [Leptobacterium flavescens]NER12820.1 sodium:solute symporter [Leptobacterium flavescens]